MRRCQYETISPLSQEVASFAIGFKGDGVTIPTKPRNMCNEVLASWTQHQVFTLDVKAGVVLVISYGRMVY